jgi:hypothetical protein
MSAWRPIDEADKRKRIMAYCGGIFCGDLVWKDRKFSNRPLPHWSDDGARRDRGPKWMQENQPTMFQYQPPPPSPEDEAAVASHATQGETIARDRHNASQKGNGQ